MNEPRFGTAGLADSYTVKKFDPAAIAAYTAGFGLTAFEYQCGRGVRLASGMTIAIEPMINLKGEGVYTLDNDWTVVTESGSPSAHFEHTIAITDNGPVILTKL